MESPDPQPPSVSALLQRARQGEGAASEELLGVLYDELKRVAQSIGQRMGPHATMNATALVHELYVSMADRDADAEWQDREHFLASAGRAMRNLLIDYARARRTLKRGGEWRRVTLGLVGAEEDSHSTAEDVGQALADLEQFEPRVAQVVELRFLAGLTSEETSRQVGVSARQVQRDWRIGQAFLKDRLTRHSSGS